MLMKALREGGGAGCLNRGDPRRVSDEADLHRLSNGLPERRSVAKVSGREHDPVWRGPVQLLENLEDDRLLSLETEWVDRVEELDPKTRARLSRKRKTIVEVAADEKR